MAPKVAHPVVHGARAVDIEQVTAEAEKGQQLTGYFPSAAALQRGRQVLYAEMTEDEAYSELDAKHRHG